MNEQDGKVEDPVTPESETSRQVDTIKVWAVKLVPVVFTVISAITAYKGAGADAKGKANEVKDKSEAGYQGIDKWVHHLDETDEVLLRRIAKLEADVAEIRRKAKLSVGKRLAEAAARPTPPAAAPVPTPPAPPPPVAPTLDKALEQIQQQQQKATTEPAPPPAPPK
jgi:hypothetical protein